MQRKPESNSKGAYWTTEDGRQIPYSMLADSHLLNIMRMLRRNAQRYWMQTASQSNAIAMLFDIDDALDVKLSISYNDALRWIKKSQTYKHLDAERKKRNLSDLIDT